MTDSEAKLYMCFSRKGKNDTANPEANKNFVQFFRELNLSGAHRLDNRPSLSDVQQAFKRATTMAFTCSISTSLVLVIIWPASMVAVGVMDLDQFVGWVSTVCGMREHMVCLLVSKSQETQPKK